MNKETMEMLADFNVTLNFNVAEINTLLNALDRPALTQTTVLVAFIDSIQGQAAPQIENAKKSLEAALKTGENNGSKETT